MKNQFYYVCLLIIMINPVWSQGVGIGTTVPDSSSVLEVKSTSQGFLMPRLTTSQRNLIEDPVQGLMVFDIDKNTIYLFDGVQWLPMLFATNANSLPLTLVHEQSGSAANDDYGASIDIDGNYAIIGAPYDDIETDTNQGSAYIFYKGNGVWTEQKKLVIGLGIAEDRFGVGVAIDGDYAVVGADHTDIGGMDKGNAWVFKRDGTNWVQLARLNAYDGSANEHFGHAVDIDGDYIVVGAYYADTDGRAYVFYKNSEWFTGQPYQEKLIPNGTNNGLFGWSVSMDGDEVLVGDPFETYSGDIFRGGAYIYTRLDTNWNLTARLTASDGSASDEFGYDVSLSGDYALIGTPDDQIGANIQQGSVYVFYKDAGWVSGQPHQYKIIASDGQINNLFGTSVSVFGDYAVIGAPFKDINGIAQVGGAYLYKRSGSTWSVIRKLDDPYPQESGEFGICTSINGFNILIGATGKHANKGEVQTLNIE